MTPKDIEKKTYLNTNNGSDNLSLARQKTEKLTAALYKVTDFMPDQEPLKWQMRDRASEILFEIVSSQFAGSHDSINVFKKASHLIWGISSLCEVAASTGVFSKMNFSVLKKEYLVLRDMLEEGHLGSLEKDFVAIRRLKINNFEKLPPAPVQREKIKTKPDVLKEEKEIRGEEVYRTPSLRTEKIEKSHKPKAKQFSINRREVIMGYIRKNGESSIKDISGAVEGCGTKTIQRELSSMVSDGVLRKKGERRWSVYSLS